MRGDEWVPNKSHRATTSKYNSGTTACMYVTKNIFIVFGLFGVHLSGNLPRIIH